MAVVDHHKGVIPLGQVADLIESGDGAVHAERPVGGDHPVANVLRFLELGLEVGHVAVFEDVSCGLAQADAVDDGGMVEGIGQDRVILAQQRLEEPAVGVEAGDVQDRIVGAEEAADLLLELFVYILRAADEAYAAHAVAVGVERLAGGLDHLRMR